MAAGDYAIIKPSFDLGVNRAKILICAMIVGLPDSHPEFGLDLPKILTLYNEIMSLDIPCTIQPPCTK